MYIKDSLYKAHVLINDKVIKLTNSIVELCHKAQSYSSLTIKTDSIMFTHFIFYGINSLIAQCINELFNNSYLNLRTPSLLSVNIPSIICNTIWALSLKPPKPLLPKLNDKHIFELMLCGYFCGSLANNACNLMLNFIAPNVALTISICLGVNPPFKLCKLASASICLIAQPYAIGFIKCLTLIGVERIDKRRIQLESIKEYERTHTT